MLKPTSKDKFQAKRNKMLAKKQEKYYLKSEHVRKLAKR